MRSIPLIIFLLPVIAINAPAQETTTAVASHRYEQPGAGERMLVGKNYRDLWSMPVTVRILHIDRAEGGLKVKALGGGMQTKTLYLEDKKGREWALRSIDKTVDKAMEAVGIHNPTIRKLSQQMLSASNPYGALTIPPLAAALGLPNTDARLVWVPDDPLLGKYRRQFANMLCILEQSQPVLYEGDEVQGTDKMLEDLKSDKGFLLDRKMLLQARLLDMLTGDWDRHEGQWKWGYHKTRDNTLIYPIPKDRDQVYFNSTGALVPIVRPFTMQMLVGFGSNLNFKNLNYKSWHFDKTLLMDLSEEDWTEGVRRFRAKLNDGIIDEAARRLPPEVYRAFGSGLTLLLRQRRDNMLPHVIHYYHFLKDKPGKVQKQHEKQEKMKKSHG